MPSISNKGLAMPESPIRKLVPYSEKAKESGKTVFHLNIGQPDIKSPLVAMDAVTIHSLSVLAYTQSEGSYKYRAKIADYYKKNDVDVIANDIVVTTGGSEALNFAFGSIMDEGDEVIIPEPFYANYNGFSTASGVKVVPVNSDIDTNFSLPPIEDFEKLITQNTKAILICNPGNPTGYLYSREELLKLKDLVLKHDLFLIADEVYREFVYDGNKHYSILSFSGLDEHTIIIDSVSKRYSMCGARIGCLVSKNKAVIQTALKFAQARLSPPTFAQIAAEAALQTPQSYFDEVIEEYVERRNLLIQELEKIEGVRVAKPKGAFYCIAELPVNDTEKFAQWLLESFSIDNKTVMVAPAAGFYSTPGKGKKEIRIAYVLEKDSLIKAVTIIKEGLKIYKD